MKCSFCGKPKDKVKALVTNTKGDHSICSECVHKNVRILEQANEWDVILPFQEPLTLA